MNTQKPVIAVLFGGRSDTRAVSQHSARAVIESIDRDRYRIVPVGIDPSGAWYVYGGSPDAIANGTWLHSPSLIPAAVSPNRHVHGLVLIANGKKLRLDAALPVLHGSGGEDGGVQGALQLAGVPIVGCGVVGSALCADKILSHRIARDAGIAVAHHAVVRATMQLKTMQEAAALIGYPLYVKPPREGFSLGVSRVARPEQLEAALDLAFSFSGEALIEQEIAGREIGVAVLGTTTLSFGVPDEVVLHGAVFDYREKHLRETAGVRVPARLADEEEKAVLALAQRLYRLLACTGFARIDLFLDEAGTLFFNEANTIPDLTKRGRFPAMFAAAGISLTGVLTAAIEEAMAR